MTAYHAVPLPRCQAAGCDRVATDEIRNERNERMMVTCARHTATQLRSYSAFPPPTTVRPRWR